MGFKEVREGDVKAKRELLGVEGDSREQQGGKRWEGGSGDANCPWQEHNESTILYN